MFRERVIRNKELSAKGGVLLLAHSILKLNISPLYIEYSTVVAAVSRLKSKVLSILLLLCEVENISFLDEAFRTPRSQDLAKSVVSQILELLKAVLNKDSRHLSTHSNRTYPMGLSQLNALRLADILSDDSNFRSYIAVHFTEVVTAIFLIPQGDFLSTWCSSCPQLKEEDAALEYDAFAAAGWVLDSFSSSDIINVTNSEFSFIPNNIPQASYALQRTALLVKVIANLHCFVPKICKEHEKNLFLNKFIECLRMDQPKALPEFSSTSDALKASTICKNMRSLLSHSESLIPIFLNEEDVQLFRIFSNQLQSMIAPKEPDVDNRFQGINLEGSGSVDKFSTLNFNEHHQEAQSIGGCSSPQRGKVALQHGINMREEMSENSVFQELDHEYNPNIFGALKEIYGDFSNVETSGSNSSSPKRKNSVRQMDYSEHRQSQEHVLDNGIQIGQGDEEAEAIHCEEKKQKKRKRTIMNEEQMSVIETALLDEPGMQRNAASVQAWADKLSDYGPEVTASQLKNWLNNRKARLARAAAKDIRPISEGDRTLPEKQGGSGAGSMDNSQESPGGEDLDVPTTATKGTARSTSRTGTIKSTTIVPTAAGVQSSQRLPSQYVVILNEHGGEVGKGKVHQVEGKWYGMSLEESGTCVLDVTELKVDRWARLPYPSEATGASFDETEAKIGLMRVLWDASRTYILQPSESV